MYNPAQGLPGKSVKLSEQTQVRNGPEIPAKRTAVDSLGITVNTNLGSRQRKPPQQIFPFNDDQAATYGLAGRNDSTVAAKRRNPPPQPLQLQAIPFQSSSHPELQLRPTSVESRTPIIIVTPTDDDTPRLQSQRMHRVASSIYTVAPSRRFSSTQPAHHDATTSFSGGDTARSREAFNRYSTTSTVLPTPSRASGWWNVVTSPFASQVSGGSSSKSSNTSDATEHAPLCEDAAPIAYGGARDLDEPNDVRNSTGGGLHSSPFRDYVIPPGGEASKYYDLNIDFKTPVLLPAGFSTPDVLQSALSAESGSDPLSPDDHEIPILLTGGAPQVLEASRKLPELQIPSQIPPKSSRAAVVETFPSLPTPVIEPRTLDTTPPEEDLLSPKSPSPVVQTATVGTIQTARSINAEASRTPVPTSKFSRGNEKTGNKSMVPPTAFRVIANNDIVPGDVNSGYDSFVKEPTRRVQDVYSAGPSPAFRLVTDDNTAPDVTLPASHDERSREPRPLQYLNTNQRSIVASRHSPTASQDSINYPLMSKENQRYVVEKYQKSSAMVAKSQRRLSRKSEQWFLIGMSVTLLIIILLAVILCMMVVYDHSDIPVESHWLNLTGYPPLPTGISTVSQPRTLREVSGCVDSRELWSCALPKGQQKATGSSHPDFRFSILFNNETISNSSLTQPVANRRAPGTISPAAYAHSLVRLARLRTRNALSSVVFTSLPAPPSIRDQIFLGRTTDSVHYPYAGEKTPFVISILSTAVPENLNVSKRSAGGSSKYGKLTQDIPPPDVNSDGTAAMAELYPYPEAQPLRLFNRGLVTEHYGFYTYFDKSIFLYSPAINASDTESAGVNDNGGAAMYDANVQCTWSQTRFLVQIWTRTGGSLLAPPRAVDATRSLHLLPGPNGTASAFDFSRPGSFPWPVTISIDRHGGDATEKGVYCYGVASNGDIVKDEKAVHGENRGYGGKLVNPAPGPFAAADLSADGNGHGGVDGGTGGCSCQWANWQ